MTTLGIDYLYLNPAKTASCSIRAVLNMRFGGMDSDQLVIPEVVASGKCICASVRNPYDRCLSLWFSMCSPNDPYLAAEAGATEPIDFLNYIISGEFRRRVAGPHPERFSAHLEQTCSEHIGNVKLDAVLHFESLLEDFNNLPFVAVGERITELPLVNRKTARGRPPRWPLKDPEFRALVEEWCKDDFERFNYKIGMMPKEVT